MNCRLCHRPLTSAASLKTGLGPVCAVRESKSPYLFAEEEIRPILHKPDFVMRRGPDGKLRFSSGLTVL